MKVRALKIEAAGDFFAGDIRPNIRLAGKWLERAGFRLGHRVELSLVEPGALTLRFVEVAPEVVSSCPKT